MYFKRLQFYCQVFLITIIQSAISTADPLSAEA